MNVDNIMNPGIAALAKELFALTDNPPARPTQKDRTALMTVRQKIKDFPRDGLDKQAQTDIGYLYVESTRAANVQENFFEQNGEEWAA